MGCILSALKQPDFIHTCDHVKILIEQNPPARLKAMPRMRTQAEMAALKARWPNYAHSGFVGGNWCLIPAEGHKFEQIKATGMDGMIVYDGVLCKVSYTMLEQMGY